MDVCVEIALLPEPFAIALEPSRSCLLQRLQELSQQNHRRLVDEQMHVLRHQHVGIDSGFVLRSRLLQYSLESLLSSGCCQRRESWKQLKVMKCRASAFWNRFKPYAIFVRISCFRRWPYEDPLIAKAAMN